MRCPRCQHENRSQAKFCEECASPLKEASSTTQWYADLKTEVERLRPALTEALEQQTATSEILQVISRSPTDVQPVFDAILASAVKLCGGLFGGIYRYDGELVEAVAAHNFPPAVLAAFKRHFPMRPHRGVVAMRAILDCSVVHVPDLELDPERTAWNAEVQSQVGFRSLIAVPMLQGGTPIGAISVAKREPGRFPDRQLALLQAFAAQAVIAIENVRLFTELEGKNLALTKAHAQVTEALDQQTATGEILRVISSSPTDLAPVMDAVTRNATRLAQADHALIGEAVEGRIRWLAASGCPLVSDGPPISHELPSGRAILDCQTTQVEDVTELTEHFPGIRRAYDEFQVRTILATPLVREGLAIGVLLVRRTTVRSFTDKEIELLKTFADQAVIAIENVRLFTELQEKNRALTEAHAQVTEALEQQTATGDVLKVISSSPTAVEPVFEAIAASAARLCEAYDATIFRRDGDRLLLVAHHGPMLSLGPIGEGALPLIRGTANGQSVLDGRTIHVRDLQTETNAFPEGSEIARRLGHKTNLSVPLIRDGVAIGTIEPSAHRGSPLYRPAGRPSRDLRRPGRHRDRERPPVQGDQGGAGAPDGHGRHPAGDLELTDGPPARLRRHRPERRAAVQRALQRPPSVRRRTDSFCRPAQFSPRRPRGGAPHIPGAPNPGPRNWAGNPQTRGGPHPRRRGRSRVRTPSAEARGRLSKRPLGTHDAGGRSHRRHRSGACRAGAVLRQPDRAAENLR